MPQETGAVFCQLLTLGLAPSLSFPAKANVIPKIHTCYQFGARYGIVDFKHIF